MQAYEISIIKFTNENLMFLTNGFLGNTHDVFHHYDKLLTVSLVELFSDALISIMIIRHTTQLKALNRFSVKTECHHRLFTLLFLLSNLIDFSMIRFIYIKEIFIFILFQDSVLMTLSHETRMTTETELIFSPERTSNSSFHAFSSKKVRKEFLRFFLYIIYFYYYR